MSAAGEVTQADRDEASRLFRARGHNNFSQLAVDGRVDDWTEVQAFARHRLATEAPFKAREAELVEALRGLENAASMVTQWRSTIMVRFDGEMDFGQWQALNASFDKIEVRRDHARAILAHTNATPGGEA
jgi:hypothetical protein